jgi:putative nucleotidyltransferase with HDIG domain
MLNPVTYERLVRRARHLENLPAMPSILTALLNALSVDSSKVDIDEIVRTISYDKSLAAQCLRMVNSVLFRQRDDITTVREAVLALGLWRIRDLVFACNLPLMFANLDCGVPAETFWRHSLAVALLAQKLGADFGNSVNEQTYLAGLLHDIGILVNAILYPDTFREVMEEALREHSQVASVEARVLGFTHAQSGRVIAELWKLPREISEVVEFHHQPEAQTTDNELTLIVEAANHFSWNSGLGYGYVLQEGTLPATNAILRTLGEKFPRAQSIRFQEYAAALDAQIVAATELADRVFRP